MIAGVADTHTALWHLFGDKRLSTAAEAEIETKRLPHTSQQAFSHRLYAAFAALIVAHRARAAAAIFLRADADMVRVGLGA